MISQTTSNTRSVITSAIYVSIPVQRLKIAVEIGEGNSDYLRLDETKNMSASYVNLAFPRRLRMQQREESVGRDARWRGSITFRNSSKLKQRERACARGPRVISYARLNETARLTHARTYVCLESTHDETFSERTRGTRRLRSLSYLRARLTRVP